MSALTRWRLSTPSSLVDESPDQRHLLDQLDVGVGVQRAKTLRHQVHDIYMGNVEVRKLELRRRAERLASTHVARAGGYAEYENAFVLHAIDRVRCVAGCNHRTDVLLRTPSVAIIAAAGDRTAETTAATA